MRIDRRISVAILAEPAARLNRVRRFHEGLAAVQENGSKYRWGFMDSFGKIAIPCIYEKVGDFDDGVTYAQKNGKFGYIDRTGCSVAPFVYGYNPTYNWAFSEGLTPVYIDDKHGRAITSFAYDAIYGFDGSLALVKLDEKWGFIDRSGSTAVPIIYDTALPFREERAAVNKDGKWGYIYKCGEVAIPLVYDCAAQFFRGGLAAVEINGRWGCVDASGHMVID
jgi:hypothetical protein